MTLSDADKYDFLYAGAFVVCHGADAGTGDPLILVIRRGSCFKPVGKDGYGMPGGHIDLEDRRETPAEAAARELGEEVINEDGRPLLGAVDPDRLIMTGAGVDYADGTPGTRHAGGAWFGFTCELTAREMKILTAFEARMKADEDFAARVREKSNQELGGVYLFAPDALLRALDAGELPFTYAHEALGARRLAEELAELQSESKPNVRAEKKRHF
jgi:hypothetical protein